MPVDTMAAPSFSMIKPVLRPFERVKFFLGFFCFRSLRVSAPLFARRDAGAGGGIKPRLDARVTCKTC
jgi:hypothetical protein